MRLACVSIMQWPVMIPITTLSAPFWSLNRLIVPFIEPWPDFTSRSTRVRGRPPVLGGIDDRIINYYNYQKGSEGCPDSGILRRVHHFCSFPEYHCVPVPIRYGSDIVPLSRRDICDSRTPSWSSSCRSSRSWQPLGCEEVWWSSAWGPFRPQ